MYNVELLCVIQCHVCVSYGVAAFPYSSSLRVHSLLHRNERPFSCDVCGKSFVTATILKRHKDVHTVRDLE